MSFLQESVLWLKERTNVADTIEYKSRRSKVEAKHTNFIGVFRLQETAQLELGR